MQQKEQFKILKTFVTSHRSFFGWCIKKFRDAFQNFKACHNIEG